MRQILFIQGAGEGAYDADIKLADGLQHELGGEYEIVYPVLSDEADPNYDDWKSQVKQELIKLQQPVTLVGHSVGASILLKCVDEIRTEIRIAGIFLLAAPFWGGEGWRYEGYEKLELAKDFAENLTQRAPVFLYHCQDDEIVAYEHLALNARMLPSATERQLTTGGHQFVGNLSTIAQDIKST